MNDMPPSAHYSGYLGSTSRDAADGDLWLDSLKSQNLNNSGCEDTAANRGDAGLSPEVLSNTVREVASTVIDTPITVVDRDPVVSPAMNLLWPPACDGSWGIDTVRVTFVVDLEQCDATSELWSKHSTQNLRDDRPLAETLIGSKVLPLDHGVQKVRVFLFTARNICHLEFNAARMVSGDRYSLLPPNHLAPLLESILNALRHEVWPAFVRITQDGEIVWDQDWQRQVRFKRLDIARNFQDSDRERIKKPLTYIVGRYQRRQTIDISSDGGWMITNVTKRSGRDRFYDKSAELKDPMDDDGVERIISGRTVFRFETQLLKPRLIDLGIFTLDALNTESAWKALVRRWQDTKWGSPLPSRSGLALALQGLEIKQRMTHIGYLFLAEAGMLDGLSRSQHRTQKQLAKKCNITPGTPIELLGPADCYLDLASGTVKPLIKEVSSLRETIDD